MVLELACPGCKSTLTVPETAFGAFVVCPHCQAAFVVGKPKPSPDAGGDGQGITATPVVRQSTTAIATPGSAQAVSGADRPNPTAERDNFLDDDVDLSGVDPDFRAKPHRGGLAMALGILCMLLFPVPIASWVLGAVTLVIAQRDLRRMDKGEMDRLGWDHTRTARTCALVGIVRATLLFLGTGRMFSPLSR
jgi:hypothetical protein